MAASINPLQTLLLVGVVVEAVAVAAIVVAVMEDAVYRSAMLSKYTEEEHQGEVPNLQEGWS